MAADDEAAGRQQEAARALAVLADQVGFAQRGGQRYRAVLRKVSGGRLGQRRGPPEILTLATPWQDTAPWEKGNDWRTRSANLDGDEAIGVDYCVCQRCQLLAAASLLGGVEVLDVAAGTGDVIGAVRSLAPRVAMRDRTVTAPPCPAADFSSDTSRNVTFLIQGSM